MNNLKHAIDARASLANPHAADAQPLFDVIVGTTGHDDITGSKGDDLIDGDDGRDTVNAKNGDDFVFGGRNDDLLNGGGGDDILLGENGDDVLNGNKGDDTLAGARGDDAYNGGQGNDTVFMGDPFGGASDGPVTVDLSITDAQDTGQGLDSFIYVENLIGTEFADTLTGDASNNFFNGNGGDDVLDGGAGDDTLLGNVGSETMAGGDGNDAFRMVNGGQNVSGGAGDDRVFAAIGGDGAIDGGDGNDTVSFYDTYFYGGDVKVNLSTVGPQNTNVGIIDITGVENLIGGSYNDTLIGSSGDNSIWGDWGNDLIRGGFGNDDLQGDTYLSFQGGAVDVFGFSDTLIGGAGNDTLTGGGGQDQMSGGKGRDTFVFDELSDSAFGAEDQIIGLQNGDYIDVSAIDADVNTDGDQAFVLVGNFTNTAGEIAVSYDNVNNITYFKFDVDGDGNGDMVIRADGDHRDYTGFVL